jgi:hypothetical protein
MTLWKAVCNASEHSLFLRLGGLRANARTCLVSFTDTEGIGHSVEVTGSSLYEAALLATAQFRNCEFTANAPASHPTDRSH